MANDIANLLQAFSIILTPTYLIYALGGCAIGTAIGVLPGLGPTMTMAMLLPVAFELGDPLGAIVLFGGVFYGSMFGGSITSILLGTPGESSGIVSLFDGYPMAQNGRAGAALLCNAVGSFIGGLLATSVIILIARPIVNIAISLGSADYFALIAFALIAVSLMGDRLWTGLFSVCFGLALGSIGTHQISGDARLDFGIIELRSGINIALIAIGLYAVSQMVINMGNIRRTPSEPKEIGKLFMTRDEWRRSAFPFLRGSGLGFVVGMLPGLGGTVGTFMSYAVEKRLAKRPWEFGKGSMEGLAGPSAADNAGSGGSFVPMLTLGIPGSAATALMLGALQGFGVQTGPLMLDQNPELVWGVVAGLLVANFMLLVLNVPLIGLWVKILKVPPQLLYPLVLTMAAVGSYSIGRTQVVLYVLLGLGVFGLLFRLVGIPLAPAVMGVVLGPLLEQNWARALTLSRGSYGVFVSTPLSAILLALGALLLASPLIARVRARLRGADEAAATIPADGAVEDPAGSAADDAREPEDVSGP